MNPDLDGVTIQQAGAMPHAMLMTIYRRRKAVFVDTLGWPLTVINGQEIDEFDGPETWMVAIGDTPIRFSMRVLPAPSCMVHRLWPAFSHLVQPDAFEMSRWCAHHPFSLADTRSDVQAMMAAFRARGWTSLFSVANHVMARSYRAFGWPPLTITPMDGDLNFCTWDLR